jgi:hypothetical protein
MALDPTHPGQAVFQIDVGSWSLLCFDLEPYIRLLTGKVDLASKRQRCCRCALEARPDVTILACARPADYER